jgi:CRP/FNR family transcriptional regulator
MPINKPLVLRRSFLFSSVSADALSRFASLARGHVFAKGDMIFEEGAAADGFYIVAAGRVKIFKLSASGDEHILHLVTDGGCFAEAVVFGRLKQYPAFAQALTQTYALFILRDGFLSLMRSDFSLVLSVFGSMSEKLRYFNGLIEELSLKEADARLAKYLLDLSMKSHGRIVTLDTRKVELARRLGIAPETLSRLFAKFKKRRILGLQGLRVTLMDVDQLRRLSSGLGAL